MLPEVDFVMLSASRIGTPAPSSVPIGRALRETDSSTLMEGLYIKVEEEGVVKERYKFVRADFLAAILRADGHWLERPIVPNRLAEGVDLFAGAG